MRGGGGKVERSGWCTQFFLTEGQKDIFGAHRMHGIHRVFLTEEQKDIFLHADGADGHGDLLAHRIHGMTQNFVFDRRT